LSATAGAGLQTNVSPLAEVSLTPPKAQCAPASTYVLVTEVPFEPLVPLVPFAPGAPLHAYVVPLADEKELPPNWHSGPARGRPR
jgi:hypothetical protein